MYEVRIREKGVTAMLQCWRNPATFVAQEIEKAEGKTRTVKDAEYYRALMCEWRGTCLWDDKIGLHLRSDYIEANTERAGATVKLGRGSMKKTAKGNAVIAPGYEMVKLHYPGMQKIKTMDDIEKNGLVDLRIVSVNRAPVPRRRVLIPMPWELEYRMLVLDESNLPPKDLEKLRRIGGTLGYGDYRPKFGTFEVVEFEVIK